MWVELQQNNSIVRVHGINKLEEDIDNTLFQMQIFQFL